ncbi:hypothetical protein [Chelativorans oligotrophicus]|uniref:hypothetical protein n=1 Tax=Chelativorans oligotrophicus TaxID=449974 RepID=UPI001409DF75|nr:hypothetical protein [Chelativorans oligotrophicus]
MIARQGNVIFLAAPRLTPSRLPPRVDALPEEDRTAVCPNFPDCGCAPECSLSPAPDLPRTSWAARILLGSILAAAVMGVWLAFN